MTDRDLQFTLVRPTRGMRVSREIHEPLSYELGSAGQSLCSTRAPGAWLPPIGLLSAMLALPWYEPIER